MQKGQTLYKTNNPIYFLPEAISYPPEQFLPISNVPGILPYYLISTYGRVYNRYSGNFLRSAIDTKGYPFVSLATVDGKGKLYRVHRLLMLTFCYIPGCEDLVANHIDEVKTNCFIWNLEWLTFADNIRYSVDANRYGKCNQYKINPTLLAGEGITSSKIIGETATKICEMLQSGMKTKEIAEKLNVTSAIVQNIADGKTWKSISKNYNIEQQSYQNLTDDQIHFICKCFEDDPKPSDCYINKYCLYILQRYLMENPTEGQLRTATSIYRRVKYTRISNNYNF